MQQTLLLNTAGVRLRCAKQERGMVSVLLRTSNVYEQLMVCKLSRILLAYPATDSFCSVGHECFGNSVYSNKSRVRDLKQTRVKEKFQTHLSDDFQRGLSSLNKLRSLTTQVDSSATTLHSKESAHAVMTDL